MKNSQCRLVNEIVLHAEGNKRELIKVEIAFSRGGINYATYKDEPRGYWLHVSVLVREQHDGYATESYTLFGSGLKHFLRPAERFSAKVLVELVPEATVLTAMVEQVKTMREAAREVQP